MSRYDEYEEYDLELPFGEADWDDVDHEYDEMVDEMVLAQIAQQRCAELTQKVQQLERENNALRKMLHDTDTIRDSMRGGR